MPLIHKTNKTSRPVKKGRKYKEITASTIHVLLWSLLLSQSAASKSFKILTHQLHTSLISYHTRSWAHFPRSRPQAWRIFQRMWGRWGWCRWGDKGGKSRSGGAGCGANLPLTMTFWLCWPPAGQQPSNTKAVKGWYPANSIPECSRQRIHTNSRESSFNHAENRRTGTRW